MKRRIITLSGMSGSGKSSTADALARALHYQRFSSGDFTRAVARSRGLSIEDISRIAVSDRTIDDAIDAEIKKAAAHDELVIDSRLAYHWIPEAFKVYLKLDPHAAAQRIHDHIHATGRMGQVAESTEATYLKMIQRTENEKKRYREYYGIDYTDPDNFDLIVDTGSNLLEQVVEIILEKYREWRAD